MAVERDALFTPDETASACVASLYSTHPELIGKPVVEPSAGAGAFLRAIDSVGLSGQVCAYDLEPMEDGIVEADYLHSDVAHFQPGTVVIGNPPYGYRNGLTKSFIDRSFELGAEKVAFLLMASTMGYGTLKRIGRRVESWHSLKTPFIAEGKSYKTGSVLSTMAWIVFSKDPLQEISVDNFSFVRTADRHNADFSSALIYGDSEIDFTMEPEAVAGRNRREYRTTQLGKPRIFFLYSGSSSLAKETARLYPFSSLNQTPAATSLNWHLEHSPEIYKGELSI